MFASIFRGRRKRKASEHSPFSSPFMSRAVSRAVRQRDINEDVSGEEAALDEQYGPEYDDDEEDPLLPIFSAELLDRLPTYNTTLSIRMLVIQKCETTLTWDQLRSPQVSQFLVKPIQQQVRATNYSRASLYALVSNCLQFQKEALSNPGNLGVSKTRAILCELLAVRLLKEYSTRELIDALFYDFDPLQGLAQPAPGVRAPSNIPRPARISTIEIAIRAQAKKFLAHPLIVQQLEAVWAGSIVFHSAADNLHRKPPKSKSSTPRNYGTVPNADPDRTPTKTTAGDVAANKDPGPTFRRTVTLYDPHDASLFKLSRLRVPRYRQLFSTCSFAIMLGLFLAVLTQKSLDITALEVVFWFWSAGFMLDEVVGFSEQGFGLYIMSVWNAFDLGILMLFMVYYVLRLYGIIMPDARKHYIAWMAYDVLASTAVLLFPRLFSVLDHYRYFSQLLIAFRMMAMDLMAILVLIVISCSGFFIALTLSFSSDVPNAGNAAYSLFQMLMGFTPAAWDLWEDSSILGKAILTLFLFICHFLIVTILITVLTNSFMAIVQNANEEHQFLFAVNTIYMVKSDALFSYVAPSNVIGWLLTPLRYVMPFRRYVKLNRTIIKCTHFILLFIIFLYEKLILARRAEEPTDLVEQRGRQPAKVPAFSIRGMEDLFSPGRIREPSMATFRQDRALEEVFRRPFRDSTPNKRGPGPSTGRQQSSYVVNNWMQGVGNEGGASPPLEQPQSVLDRLESRRPKIHRRTKTSEKLGPRYRQGLPRDRSFNSDPEEQKAYAMDDSILEVEEPSLNLDDPVETDADGDDELVTQDEDIDEQNDEASDHDKQQNEKELGSESEDYFRTPATSKHRSPTFPSPINSDRKTSDHTSRPTTSSATRKRPVHSHARNASTNTILYSPVQPLAQLPTNVQPRSLSPHKRPTTSRTQTRVGTGGLSRTPVRSSHMAAAHPSRPRPIPQSRDHNRSSPHLSGLLNVNLRDRIPSMNTQALDLASDIGDNRHVPDIGALGGMPASFNTQMEYAARQRQEEGKMVDRIMLSRMSQLEEGFREVIQEVKGWRSRDNSKPVSKAASLKSSVEDASWMGPATALARKRSKKEKGKSKVSVVAAASAALRKDSTKTVMGAVQERDENDRPEPSGADVMIAEAKAEFNNDEVLPFGFGAGPSSL